jgi:hypothetical protein
MAAHGGYRIYDLALHSSWLFKSCLTRRGEGFETHGRRCMMFTSRAPAGNALRRKFTSYFISSALHTDLELNIFARLHTFRGQ